MTLLAGARLGPYEIVAPLGAGGMGEVWRAKDTRLGREVAIKVLPADVAGDPERLRRFEQEARAASALSHPNILTLFDVGRDGETSYLVSELLDGRSLREILAVGEPVAPRKALDWAAQIARGLAAAHEKGIIHRDLKPENLFLTKEGVVKILDFGLAKLVSPESGVDLAAGTTIAGATGTGIVMGTAGYMAPEQVRGERVDARSDLFAFGCVVYELLSGARAFGRDTAVDTLSAILRDEPPPLALSRSGAAIPAELAHVVERCLAKAPGDRWQSARDLAFRLDELAPATSGAAARPGEPRGVTPRTSAWRRRLPWTLAALLAAALAWIAMRSPRSEPIVWQRLSFRRGIPTRGRLAPDGRTVLFSEVLSPRQQSLFSTRLDSPESTPLALPAGTLFSVSAQGQIAFGVQHGEPWWTLAVASLAGGGAREVAQGIVDADFSPDGSRIAAIHALADRSVLELPVGTRLYDPGRSVGLSEVRFSPQGDRLAVVEVRQAAGLEEHSLVTIDLSGKRTLFSSGWGGIYGVAWRPTTGEIWFSAQSTEHPGGLMLYATSGPGASRLVTTSPGLLRIEDVLPDGRALLLHSDWPSTLVCRPPGSTSEKDLTWLDFSVARGLSDDGRSVLIGENGIAGGGRGAVYLRPTDGGDAIRLADGEAVELSPDGRRILAETGKTPASFALLPAGAGAPQALSMPGREIRSVRFLPGRAELLFAVRTNGGPVELVVAAPGATDGRKVASGELSLGPISPDGRSALIESQADGVQLVALDGSGTRTPLPGIEVNLDFPLRFAGDGTALYLARGDVPVAIDRYDLATHRRTTLYRLGSELIAGIRFVNGVHLSADGSSYCYSYLRDTSELYLVSGLQ